MTLNPPAPAPPQQRGWRGWLTALLVLGALVAGFWLGGGLAFANTGGGACSSSWVLESHTSSGCTYEKFWSPSDCGAPGHTCTEATGTSGCGYYCAPLSSPPSCNPNTIQDCWAVPICHGDNATNGCGNAVYSSSCNSGCSGSPVCTPTGGNTIHFLNKCTGSCTQGWYDQTNSCGTVTVAAYKSYAAGCNTVADGCPATPPPSCTPTATLTGCASCGEGNFAYSGCGATTYGTAPSSKCTGTYWCGSTTPPSCTPTPTLTGCASCGEGNFAYSGCGATTYGTAPTSKCTGTYWCGSTTPPPSCTAPQPGPVSSNGPYVTGCASQGEYSTITYHSQVVWSCPGPTSTTNHWSTTGTQATSDCQPIIKIDGTKPLACAAAPDTGSAWSSYTYQHCLSYLGNAVNCGPTLTYTPPTPYQAQGGQFPEPVYNPVACPVPIAVGT